MPNGDLANKVQNAENYWNAHRGIAIPEVVKYQQPRMTPRKILEKKPTNNQVNWSEPLEQSKPKDLQIDDLTARFAKMEVRLANALKHLENPRPRQYFGRNERYQANQQSNNRQMEVNQTTRRCYKCNEPGHFANECLSEKPQRSQPQRNQLNVVQICDDPDWYSEEDYQSDASDEQLYQEVYPIEKRAAGRPRKQPYPRNPNKRTATAETGETQHNERMDDTPELIHSESTTEMKLKKTKTYDFNAWKALSQEQPNITWEQLLQICPKARVQVREGISSVQPGYEIRNVNTVETNSNEKTSMYGICHIEDRQVNAILDSGAGSCVVTKKFLDLMGWGIDAPADIKFLLADGKHVKPLGIVHNVPIRFGNFTIPINAYVGESTEYDIIIGNNWLSKARAMIDYDKLTLAIKWRGRVNDFPISIERGVRPAFQDEDYEKDYQENEDTPDTGVIYTM
jgi:hypothetical protein